MGDGSARISTEFCLAPELMLIPPPPLSRPVGRDVKDGIPVVCSGDQPCQAALAQLGLFWRGKQQMLRLGQQLDLGGGC